jgi:hypothetical protein
MWNMTAHIEMQWLIHSVYLWIVKFSSWKSVFNGFQLGNFLPIFVNMSTQIFFFTNDSNMSIEFVYMHICKTTSLGQKNQAKV